MSETTVQQRLRDLGVQLPAVPVPVGAYVPALRVGQTVFTSGQLPLAGGKLLASGKVPGDVLLPAAQAAARQAAVNALAAVQSVLGSLDRVEQVVRLHVYVNSSLGFTDQAKVANGASDLLHEVFGAAGVHTRFAVGVAELPLNAPVELDLIVQTKGRRQE